MRLFSSLLIMSFMLVSLPVIADDGHVHPVLQVIQMLISFLHIQFPVAGPIIQLVLEVIAAIATFFTLLVVFVSGTLQIPLVAARVAKADEIVTKIQKLHDKIVPILKKASIFNSPSKKD